MLSDNTPLLSTFISVPRDLELLNVNAFIAGMLESILEGMQFPACVTAHSTASEGIAGRTTYLIRFDKSGIVKSYLLFIKFFF